MTKNSPSSSVVHPPNTHMYDFPSYSTLMGLSPPQTGGSTMLSASSGYASTTQLSEILTARTLTVTRPIPLLLMRTRTRFVEAGCTGGACGAGGGGVNVLGFAGPGTAKPVTWGMTWSTATWYSGLALRSPASGGRGSVTAGSGPEAVVTLGSDLNEPSASWCMTAMGAASLPMTDPFPIGLPSIRVPCIFLGTDGERRYVMAMCRILGARLDYARGCCRRGG